MSQTVTIQLEKPIASAKLLSEAENEPVRASVETEQIERLKQEKESLSQASQALRDAVNKTNDLQENIFKGHKKQIAKLAVEIARKILVQKVQEGDYKIESIVKETLKSTPTHQNMVVHLNPEDLAQCQKALQDDAGSMDGIKFVADSNIGRAECLVETPKGIIESLVEEHLERIGKALSNSE